MVSLRESSGHLVGRPFRNEPQAYDGSDSVEAGRLLQTLSQRASSYSVFGSDPHKTCVTVSSTNCLEAALEQVHPAVTGFVVKGEVK